MQQDNNLKYIRHCCKEQLRNKKNKVNDLKRPNHSPDLNPMKMLKRDQKEADSSNILELKLLYVE